MDRKVGFIERIESYVGVRPGRRLTFKERFQVDPTVPINRSIFRFAAVLTVGHAVVSLVGGTDIRFSEILIYFALSFGIEVGLFVILRAFGRRSRPKSTH